MEKRKQEWMPTVDHEEEEIGRERGEDLPEWRSERGEWKIAMLGAWKHWGCWNQDNEGEEGEE